MPLTLKATQLKGVFDVILPHYPDRRGSFSELYNANSWLQTLGAPFVCIQVNHSYSHQHVLRGLHFQHPPHGQAKFVYVLDGQIMDVVVDLRPKEPTYGQHIVRQLQADNSQGLFIPKGCAHGFLTLSKSALVQYIIDYPRIPEAEAGIRYDDPDLNISWPIAPSHLVLSDKDQALGSFAELRPRLESS